MARSIVYAHDPMCSWCWAFRPTWQKIVDQLPEDVSVRRLLGGLAPDSQDPMPSNMQDFLQTTWSTIQNRLPGTQFNFEFWTQCNPRRSTYPACRAVIAARKQQPSCEETMIFAIQRAYYLQAMNPSDDSTLVALAETLQLDKSRFERDLNAPKTQQELEQEIVLGQRLGVNGFPSLVLIEEDKARVLRYEYNDPQVVIEQLT